MKRKLIHKNCGGQIIISQGDVGQPEEGHCLKCKEIIMYPEQIDCEKSKKEDQL